LVITPKPSPTPLPVDPRINITNPNPNTVLFLGEALAVRGLIEMEPDQSVLVSLVSSNGRTLAESPGTLNEVGWAADLIIPINVSGSARVEVRLQDAGGETAAIHAVPVWLTARAGADDRFLRVDQPQVLETVVSGFSLFFDGEVYLPVNNVISVSIWANDCQERVAVQSYVLGRSNNPFAWQGFVVVPKDLVGSACAIASTGDPAEGEWREVVIPIEVLATDDPGARGVEIASPRSESNVFAGAELLFYGTAQNVAVETVTVSVLMDNGRVVGQSQTTTDYWGYWETSLFLPVDIAGVAEITVAAGVGDAYAQETTRINVLPAPTPTALP
jgi:hypothetical protein